jgi:peptide/nickel transport system ATP-binding protein
MIASLRDRYQTAMLLITHDLGVVAQMAEDVAIIYAGQIVERGSLEDIFTRTAHPYTKGLFAALPTATGKRLRPIPGMPPDPTNLPPACAFAPRCPLASEACRSGEIPEKWLSGDHFVRCINMGGSHE